MPAKKMLTAGEGAASAVRKPKPSLTRAAGQQWSQQDIDHQWEQIRVRGEQISADIAALRARISSN